MIDQNEIKSAFNHFVMGWHFITQKGLRRFVIMPILLNVVLLTGLFWLFVSQISTMIDWVMSFIPDWLSFLSVILLVLSIGSILLFFYFAFTTLSGFIAAPFNGLLAEKVEKMLTGEAVNDDGFAEIMNTVIGYKYISLDKLLQICILHNTHTACAHIINMIIPCNRVFTLGIYNAAHSAISYDAVFDIDVIGILNIYPVSHCALDYQILKAYVLTSLN